ncbi:MAG: hypothetical protein Kow00121_47420 [Elainellaceae cyanobacterium]
MQHSLLDRFRGTLLGTALGEIIGVNCHDRQRIGLPLSRFTLLQWGFCTPSVAPAAWGRLIMAQMREVAESQLGSDVNLLPLASHSAIDNCSSKQTADLPDPGNLPALSNPSCLAGAALMTIPMALFYHEDLEQLRYQVEQTIARSMPGTSPIAAILTGYTIALALRDRLDPNRLIDQLLNLELCAQAPQIEAQLRQIQYALEQQAGIVELQSLLQVALPEAISGFTTVAIALYCFLSTPEDFRLSLLRATRFLEQPQLCCALAGALSGAYNSLSGLPLTWQNQLMPQAASKPPLSLLWNLMSRADLLQQADLFLGVWSGLHPSLLTAQPAAITSRLITASPSLIRPR